MTLTRRTGFATLAAAVAAGLQAVVILVISKAALPATEFAPLAQLWAIWAVCAASFNYGCQQWAAVRPAGFGILATSAGRQLLGALCVIGLLVGAATYLVRDELFSSRSLWWPFFASLLPLGTAAVGLNRGELARTGRSMALAFVIGAENTLRIAITIVLAVVGAPAWTYGAALVAGFAVAALPRPSRDYHEDLDLRPLATATGSGMAAHALLFGSPLILALGGGDPDEVVALFLVLSAVRAPFVLLQGLIPHVAVRFGQNEGDLRRTVRFLTATGLIAAIFAYVGGALLGDAVVGRIFSIQGELSGSTFGLVAATAMLSVALTIVTVRLVASEQIRPLVLAWSIPVIATVCAIPTGLLDNISTTAWWILGCHLFVSLIVVVVTPDRASASHDEADSADSVVDRPHSPPPALR
ncbi:hypothetical protein [Ilumatobacter sp.]|uniref:hypothetical protein n=1 Tax=Ilumatobacter sp. TaxID=1967498 RepID=UPI003C62599C